MHLTKQDKNLIRWIDALISGKYKQLPRSLLWTTNQLYDPKSNCCCALGVAAKVMNVPQFREWFLFGLSQASKLYAPQQWFQQTFGTKIDQNIVSYMSDYEESFAEIAVWLAQYLPHTDPGCQRLYWRVIKVVKQERLTGLPE